MAELLAMSLWFTGTAVLPQVTQIWRSDLALGSWLTVAVQIGFALGAITFALFNVPDVFRPVTVLVVSSIAAAAGKSAFDHSPRVPLPPLLLTRASDIFPARGYPPGL